MMTSTIAISTKVKPASVEFLLLKADAVIGASKAQKSRSVGGNVHELVAERL